MQSFKNYYGLIAKLTQTGTILEYHDTFEKYLNRGIPESELFTLFVAGLNPDMQECLRLLRPASLAEAMALSLEFTDMEADRKQQPGTNSRRSWLGRDNRQPVSGTTQPPDQPAYGTAQQPITNIWVSRAEKSERSRLGFCWHCPEKWVIGHVCK